MKTFRRKFIFLCYKKCKTEELEEARLQYFQVIISTSSEILLHYHTVFQFYFAEINIITYFAVSKKKSNQALAILIRTQLSKFLSKLSLLPKYCFK